MKVKIKVDSTIELDIPQYVFKAYNEQHFMWMLNDYIRECMMSPDWWEASERDLEELRITYNRMRKGEDRVDGERERGNTL